MNGKKAWKASFESGDITMDLAFNELSMFPRASSREIARTRVKTFLETLKTAFKHGISRQLRTQEAFKDFLLAEGYSWWAWTTDPVVDRDERQYLKALATRSPFLDGLNEVQKQESGFEFATGNQPAKGLGAAYLIGDLAVSVLSEDRWDSHEVLLDVKELLCDGNIREFSTSIHHASMPDHIQGHHRNWITERLSLSVTDSADLWNRSSIFFPSLIFCQSVQDQMKQLPNEALSAILRGLFCLEDYCRGWVSGGFNQNLLGCASTTESEPTRNQYGQERTFLCPDGINRLFSYHAKPGQSWRIHYDPAPGPGKLFIGYVGRHLRTVRHDH